MSKSITSTAAIKAIGVTRHTLLKWEEILNLQIPRETQKNGQEIRVYPERLVNNLKALNTLLTDLEIGLGEWLQWEQRLALNQGRDLFRAPDFAEPYWAKYYQQLAKDMAEATVDLDELLRWEWELDLKYPSDSYGNRALNRDWIHYLRGVQEKYAQGWNVERVYYLERPNQRALQTAGRGYVQHSPEM